MTGAQIVFTEWDRGVWRGRLLRPSACVDTQRSGRLVTGTPRFDIEQLSTGGFHVTMHGDAVGGRRYAIYATLDEAQRAGIRWAARRFRVKKGSES